MTCEQRYHFQAKFHQNNEIFLHFYLLGTTLFLGPQSLLGAPRRAQNWPNMPIKCPKVPIQWPIYTKTLALKLVCLESFGRGPQRFSGSQTPRTVPKAAEKASEGHRIKNSEIQSVGPNMSNLCKLVRKLKYLEKNNTVLTSSKFHNFSNPNKKNENARIWQQLPKDHFVSSKKFVQMGQAGCNAAARSPEGQMPNIRNSASAGIHTVTLY